MNILSFVPVACKLVGKQYKHPGINDYALPLLMTTLIDTSIILPKSVECSSVSNFLLREDISCLD